MKQPEIHCNELEWLNVVKTSSQLYTRCQKLVSIGFYLFVIKPIVSLPKKMSAIPRICVLASCLRAHTCSTVGGDAALGCTAGGSKQLVVALGDGELHIVHRRGAHIGAAVHLQGVQRQLLVP